MYTITSNEANKAAKLIVKQSTHADIDYLVKAALRGLFGNTVIVDLAREDDTCEYEAAANAYGALEYHVVTLVRA